LIAALYRQGVCELNLGSFSDALQDATRALNLARTVRERQAEFLALRLLAMIRAYRPAPSGRSH
jgi:4'-phosphopantetheinyl transferase EntD